MSKNTLYYLEPNWNPINWGHTSSPFAAQVKLSISLSLTQMSIRNELKASLVVKLLEAPKKVVGPLYGEMFVDVDVDGKRLHIFPSFKRNLQRPYI